MNAETNAKPIIEMYYPHLIQGVVLFHKNGLISHEDMDWMLHKVSFQNQDSMIKYFYIIALIDSTYKSGMLPYDIRYLKDETKENIIKLADISEGMLKQLSNQKKIYLDSEIDLTKSYKGLVSKAEIDFYSNNTIIDMKCTKTRVTSKERLAILIYQLLLQASEKSFLKQAHKLAFIYPRRNIIEHIDLKQIPTDTETYDYIQGLKTLIFKQ